MKKSISIQTNYFEDYRMLAIVSTLKDYTLAHFINKVLDFKLEKFDDFRLTEKGKTYSWYYFKLGKKYMSCYLIGNNHHGQKLLASLKSFDFFFIVKDAIDQTQIQQMASDIRNIQNVVGVFEQNIPAIQDMDKLIESNELHEMEQIISPAYQLKNKM